MLIYLENTHCVQKRFSNHNYINNVIIMVISGLILIFHKIYKREKDTRYTLKDNWII